ncbi:MAG: hypothetical protein LLG01_10085 [Planctomycetaceae bacterium]|nr:hypothetical protein [Planctomycetaceae bacterium]
MSQGNVPNVPPPMYQQYAWPTAPARPVWPIVIGIISTILGSLSVLGGLGGVLTAGAIAKFGTAPNLYDYAADWYRPFMTILGVIGLGASACLLIGGIRLLKRRPVARMLHLVYALAAIVVASVNLCGQVAALDFSSMPAPLRFGTIIGFAAMPLSVAYPIFLIVWFSRAKIRSHVTAM